MAQLQWDTGCSYLFITDSLDVVPHTFYHVLVMSGGQIVEEGETGEVLLNPQHEFTKELIVATPRLGG